MKFSKKLLLAFLLCLGGLFFHSCSEDWDKWETISAEIDASALQGAEIPYEGDKKMISIKTNSNWEITGNEWITFNKTSGIGDDVVEITILENLTKKSRKGQVNLKLGQESSENIIGIKTESFSFLQHSLYEDQTNSITVYLKDCRIFTRATPPGITGGIIHYGDLTCIIESELENINEIIAEIGVKLYFQGNHTSWGDPTSNTEYISLSPDEFTIGEHKLTYEVRNVESYGFKKITFTPYIVTTEGERKEFASTTKSIPQL